MLDGREVVEYVNDADRPDFVVWVITTDDEPGTQAVYFATHVYRFGWVAVAPDRRSTQAARLRDARMWALGGNGRVTGGHAEVRERVVMSDCEVRQLIPA